MRPAITIEVLPADRGDSLWIECRRRGRPWRLLFDGGMPDTWPVLRDRIARLKGEDRVIDLVVVSHIDSDHIGGLLPLFSEDLDVTLGDIWFNGLSHLPEAMAATARSVKEGENLVEILLGKDREKPLAWNVAFKGGAVTTGKDGSFRKINVEGWPDITLLSPTHRRLFALRKVWKEELDRLRDATKEDDLRPRAPLERLDDLEALALIKTASDRSVANGSSIAFLLEHEGASCLLSADAHVSVLRAALTSLAVHRGDRSLQVDALKISHHGSKGNVSKNLLKLVSARHYIVSTNGDRFGHPDDVALARILTAAGHGSTLWFNYANPANERWGATDLCKRFGYATQFPQTNGGVHLELLGREGANSE